MASMNSGGQYAHPKKKTQSRKEINMGFSFNKTTNWNKLTNWVGKSLNDITGASATAKQNYTWNKEFAQNAHQWEVADMEKAGLNPILSADGSGAEGNVQTPSSNGGAMITGLLNSLLDYQIMGKQNDIAQQDVNAKSALAEAEKKKKEEETFEQMMRNKYLPDYIKVELAERKARTQLLGEQSDLTQQQTSNAKMDWGIKQAEYEINSQEAYKKMWENVNNQSEAEFVKKYHVTKDQAIEIYKSTGIIIGSIIPHKLDVTTGKTSAKKEPHFDNKKGK